VRILALDVATRCGFAYGQPGSAIASGTWDLSRRRDESDGMKLIRFEAKLNAAADAGVDLLVFEAARHAAQAMQGALVHQAKMQGVLERWAAERGYQYRGYSPAEIKKHATGKGNAKKAEVIAAVRARYGYTGNDDNEADAIALLHLAIEEYGSVHK
jgi:crossover junction endodeoxyribonuclease RuvC